MRTFVEEYIILVQINIRFWSYSRFSNEIFISFSGGFFQYSLYFYFHFLLLFRIVAISTVLRAEPSRAICFPSYICRKSLINRHCVQRRQSKTWSIISGIRLQLAGLIVEHKLLNHTAGLRSVSYHSHPLLLFYLPISVCCYYSLGFLHTHTRTSIQLPKALDHISLL